VDGRAHPRMDDGCILQALEVGSHQVQARHRGRLQLMPLTPPWDSGTVSTVRQADNLEFISQFGSGCSDF
jgi:hypothetical protein